jgi:hypothetical protein
VGVVHAAGVARVVGFVRAAGVGRAAEVGREAGAVHAAGVGARRNLSAQRRSGALRGSFVQRGSGGLRGLAAAWRAITVMEAGKRKWKEVHDQHDLGENKNKPRPRCGDQSTSVN